jgi:ubiquinone/menaquinone biosynthesis C-methylase UbiE
MTNTLPSAPNFLSQVVNGILAIKPIANFAKKQARELIIKRAEAIGVPWRKEVAALQSRGENISFSPQWDADLQTVINPNLTYPEYYLQPFHAYEKGNLSWDAATEVEVAAYSVHAKIWGGENKQGDAKLRDSYHQILRNAITLPQTILDLGCSVGMSSFALQEIYPQAQITGVDLSPYFLAVAKYRSQQNHSSIKWLHSAAENTQLQDESFDLVSTFLMFHELPQSAIKDIIQEAKRVLKTGGYLGIMDMNPQAETFMKMPPYILTLLKSTEPYLDQYFTLDIKQALLDAGFRDVTITSNSPRHRTIIAQK